MSTTAASGSGESPAGRDYGDDKNLPRSGLLEPPLNRSAKQLRCLVPVALRALARG